MDQTLLESKLKKAFDLSLHLKDPTDYLSLQFAKSANWDSITHLQLITAIENEFDIMLETQDVLDMNSFSSALTIVKKYALLPPK